MKITIRAVVLLALLTVSALAQVRPTSVKLCGSDYSISYVEHMHEKELLGEIVYHDFAITIKDGLKLEAERQVLLHEIIHGLLNCRGDHEFRDDDALADFFSYAILQLLKENPSLGEYLFPRPAPPAEGTFGQGCCVTPAPLWQAPIVPARPDNYHIPDHSDEEHRIR